MFQLSCRSSDASPLSCPHLPCLLVPRLRVLVGATVNHLGTVCAFVKLAFFNLIFKPDPVLFTQRLLSVVSFVGSVV